MASREDRIAELESLVRYHANLYYNESKTEITDAEYDALVDELKTLDPDNSVIAEVGASPSYGKKIKHPSVMGSLDKEITIDGVIQWHQRYGKENPKVGIMPKIDGASLRLRYQNGNLVEAASRGDGYVGQDVMDNVKAMKSVPKYETGLTAEVRLEVYMKKSVFERLKNSGDRAIANPRNAASGSLMAKDPEITASRELDIFVHDVIPEDVVFETESEKRAWMVVNMPSFSFVEMQMIDVKDFEGQALSWEVLRPGLDYQIDGLVIALDSIADQEEAGWNGKRPRGKLAYKFKPEQKNAKVLEIDWQVGRTGRLTPMARIEPTLVDGSTISNITLHNYARVAELDVAVGDEVLIEKAGDIIPQVVRVNDRTQRVVNAGISRYIYKCPACGGDVESDSINLWCKNALCPAQLERRVLHYVKTLEVMGVGPGIISGLCRAGYIKDIPDLYYLTSSQLKAVTGGDRAAEKAKEAILEKNEIPLAVFLDALGIDGLGTSTSKDLANKFKKLGQVMFVQNPAVFAAIDGVGDLTARKIISGLQAMAPMIEKLCDVIDINDVKEVTGNLKGLSFCLTGAMSKPRKEIEKAIEAAGGEARSSVGKGLIYLVQADASSTSSKSEKAKKFGTKVIGEDELWRMMK
jgi:DNA ligase (NAD+)